MKRPSSVSAGAGDEREALGEEQFGEVLREHLDEEGARNVLRMLDEVGREE